MKSAKTITKSNLTNSNLSKYITIGGIGLGILGASYFLVRALRKKILPKETVIKILHDLRRELFPLFNRLAGEGNQQVKTNWQLDTMNRAFRRMLQEAGK